jgi:hypothetical protein
MAPIGTRHAKQPTPRDPSTQFPALGDGAPEEAFTGGLHLSPPPVKDARPRGPPIATGYPRHPDIIAASQPATLKHICVGPPPMLNGAPAETPAAGASPATGAAPAAGAATAAAREKRASLGLGGTVSGGASDLAYASLGEAPAPDGAPEAAPADSEMDAELSELGLPPAPTKATFSLEAVLAKASGQITSHKADEIKNEAADESQRVKDWQRKHKHSRRSTAATGATKRRLDKLRELQEAGHITSEEVDFRKSRLESQITSCRAARLEQPRSDAHQHTMASGVCACPGRCAGARLRGRALRYNRQEPCQRHLRERHRRRVRQWPRIPLSGRRAQQQRGDAHAAHLT